MSIDVGSAASGSRQSSATSTTNSSAAEAPEPGATFRGRLALAAIALISGVLAAMSGPAPTGTTAVDVMLIGVSTAALTLLGSGSRACAAGACAAAGVLSFDLPGLAVGTAASAAGLLVERRSESDPLVNATLVGIAVNLLVRSNLEAFHGSSTVVAVILAAIVTTVGLIRLPRTRRRHIALGAGIIAFILLASCVAFAVGAWRATGDLRNARALTEDGMDALRRGDLEEAERAFDRAAVGFEAASANTDSVLSTATRLVPGVAQHHRAISALSSAAAKSTRVIADELGGTDQDSLSMIAGRIDIEQIQALATSLRIIDGQISSLAATVEQVDDPWLLPPIAERLDRLRSTIETQRERSHRLLDVADAAPELLGATGTRTYFVAFTTPSEARGIGGFMGNWAEVSVTNGAVEMTRFGRADDLNQAGDPSARRFPADEPDFAGWLQRYGTYGLNSGPGGTTGDQVWKNLNMSPDMSMTGRAIASLYPQSGGTHLDGVVVMDVYVLARLLDVTGPIALPDEDPASPARALTSGSAIPYLMHEQYENTKTDVRVDMLEEFSRVVLASLLEQTLPPPDQLARVLRPMVEQGRLSIWMAQPDEQVLTQELGLTGTLAGVGTHDAVGFTFNNAAGNKIDYYAKAEANYEVAADARTGRARASLTLDIANGAPTSGEPAYVIGNLVGLPVGTNRTLVSVFSRMPITDALFNGGPMATESGFEAGYFVTSAFVTVAAGESVHLEFDMEGPHVAQGYTVDMRTPPVVDSVPSDVQATWTDGNGVAHRRVASFEDPGLHHLEVSG